MWEPLRLTNLWASTTCYRNSFTILQIVLKTIIHIIRILNKICLKSSAWNYWTLTWHNFIGILYTRLSPTLNYILKFAQSFYFYITPVDVVEAILSLFKMLIFITDSDAMQNYCRTLNFSSNTVCQHTKMNALLTKNVCKKLRSLSPQANYTDWATAACRPS
jgi:hypothetical protein